MLIAGKEEIRCSDFESWPSLEVQVKEKMNGKQPELEKHGVGNCLSNSLR